MNVLLDITKIVMIISVKDAIYNVLNVKVLYILTVVIVEIIHISIISNVYMIVLTKNSKILQITLVWNVIAGVISVTDLFLLNVLSV